MYRYILFNLEYLCTDICCFFCTADTAGSVFNFKLHIFDISMQYVGMTKSPPVF